MSNRKLVTNVKPEYWLEIDGDEELVHIDDKSIDTITRACTFAVETAKKLGKQVKVRSMTTLAVFQPHAAESL